MNRCAVAVIGHVDHGKTALVRALTGIETDRLKEEQERGLSIALGFAWRDYRSDGVDLIDAPGHEDFIRTMVSGASGARAVLLVVSATDGFERQTIEHLQIASLLGIDIGVIAATKADLLPPDEHAARGAAIRLALAGTALRDQPIIVCSARTGAGLDALHEALAALPARCAPPPTLPGAYLPIDRVFNIRGAGTVVTGTLLGAAIHRGDAMVLQPSGLSVTVRGVQAREVEREAIEPGRRTAVNIRGAAVHDVGVGDVLCAPDVFAASTRLDVKITLAAESARPLEHLEAVRVLFGTRAASGSVRLLNGGSLGPGEVGWAQLRFNSNVVAFTGQRAVLRRLSPAATIGGAVLLDPSPMISRRRDTDRIAVLQAVETRDATRIAAALAGRGGGILAVEDVARLACLETRAVPGILATDCEIIDARRLASRAMAGEAEGIYLTTLAEAHRAAPAKPGPQVSAIRRAVVRQFAPSLVEHVESVLARAGKITLARGRVALAGHDPIGALGPGDHARLDRIEASIRDGGTAPPDPADLRVMAGDGDLLDLLVASGRVVALENFALRKTLMFHVEALDTAFERLAGSFPPAAEFTTGQAREALATSRKFIVPILEHFDARGLTGRVGDLRHVALRE